jgi:5-(carboxyamino)imidazole ribonucleotide mutase
VLGVPVPSKHLQGVDSLHSIVQMPKGIPVATFAIGAAGAANAALFAVAMLAAHDAALAKQLDTYRAEQTRAARAQDLPVTGLSDGLAGL